MEISEVYKKNNFTNYAPKLQNSETSVSGENKTFTNLVDTFYSYRKIVMNNKENPTKFQKYLSTTFSRSRVEWLALSIRLLDSPRVQRVSAYGETDTNLVFLPFPTLNDPLLLHHPSGLSPPQLYGNRR